MAKYGSDDVFLLADGYDLSGETIELSQEAEVATEETHGFGDAWVEVDGTGVMKGTVSQRAFYDDRAASTEQLYVANVGLVTIVSAGVEGNEQGRRVVCQNAVQRTVARTTARAEFHKIASEFLSHGAVVDATIVQSLDEHPITGTRQGTDGALDAGAASLDGGRAIIQVPEVVLDGATNIGVKLQQSSDNGALDPWADIPGAPGQQVVTAPAAVLERVPPGTTIEQYVRVQITPTGAVGTNTAVTLLAAIQRD